MLLLKMSLVLKLKVTNANSNMITFLNIVLFDIKKSMMKKKINNFCDFQLVWTEKNAARIIPGNDFYI